MEGVGGKGERGGGARGRGVDRGRREAGRGCEAHAQKPWLVYSVTEPDRAYSPDLLPFWVLTLWSSALFSVAEKKKTSVDHCTSWDSTMPAQASSHSDDSVQGQIRWTNLVHTIPQSHGVADTRASGSQTNKVKFPVETIIYNLE